MPWLFQTFPYYPSVFSYDQPVTTLGKSLFCVVFCCVFLVQQLNTEELGIHPQKRDKNPQLHIKRSVSGNCNEKTKRKELELPGVGLSYPVAQKLGQSPRLWEAEVQRSSVCGDLNPCLRARRCSEVRALAHTQPNSRQVVVKLILVGPHAV